MQPDLTSGPAIGTFDIYLKAELDVLTQMMHL